MVEANVTAIPVQTVLSEAGSNVTLACPGVTEHSLVSVLEWRSHIKLVEYTGESTTMWEQTPHMGHRITLLPDTFALHFHPVTAEDSAEYSCLVNNRPKPEAIVKLVVQAQVANWRLAGHVVNLNNRCTNISELGPRHWQMGPGRPRTRWAKSRGTLNQDF
ncbi:hypothetical protein C0J52_10809 [Blattella germanica]|nr:hypothetical protein C0J52_10809 [Blattella germanica]